MTVPDPARTLRESLAPVVAAAGLVLEELDVRPGPGGRSTRSVRVVVDLPEHETGSVDLDTLAEVTRAVSARLDEADEVLGTAPYELEVTTPGAERALTAPRHFRRARTRLLSLRTREGRDLTARLLDVSEDDVLRLRPERAPGARPTARRTPPPEVELPLAEVAAARVLLEFSRPADAGGPDHIDEED